MIDHFLGRPSVSFRKYQVLAVVFVWSAYLLKGNRHGPPTLRRLSTSLTSQLTSWQTVVITLLWLYISRNFGKLVGLECPEPLANLYSRSFFRATWVTTALDAGFWTAMPIRRKGWRDFCSIAFTIYYLFCAEQADEKVRKVRAVLTVDHLRVSWNKPTSPYLGFLTSIMRPRLMRYKPRAIRIPRPQESAYMEPVHAWLYYDGPLSALKKQTKIILDFPGGGFVAMNPRTHDDSLMAWAGKSGLPVLSIDYRKAPEYPYPYALNECYDVYSTLIASRGRCIGLSGVVLPSIVIVGDSAGGNLAAGVTLMVLQSGSTDTRRWHSEASLPPPDGLILLYPALDMNIGNWMTDEQMALISDRGVRKINKSVLSRKNSVYHELDPTTPAPSDDEADDGDASQMISATARQRGGEPATTHESKGIRTRLAVPSFISYVSDRILTPEMLRAMIILYIGPHNRPAFSTEYLLSPILAPDSLLAQFPKTYFLTGERDPLVDDTVIMAGRIRAAKLARWKEREEMGLLTAEQRRRGFLDKQWIEVKLIQGVSHGFLQLAGVWPEAWGFIDGVAGWLTDAFSWAEYSRSRERARQRWIQQSSRTTAPKDRHHRRSATASSGVSDDDGPLEMSMSLGGGVREKLNRRSPPRRSGDPEDMGMDHDSEPDIPPTPTTPHGGLARGHPLMKSKRKSLVSLGSEDDLLQRRMKGLTTGLTANDET